MPMLDPVIPRPTRKEISFSSTKSGSLIGIFMESSSCEKEGGDPEEVQPNDVTMALRNFNKNIN
jgi:hypothetical protein